SGFARRGGRAPWHERQGPPRLHRRPQAAGLTPPLPLYSRAFLSYASPDCLRTGTVDARSTTRGNFSFPRSDTSTRPGAISGKKGRTAPSAWVRRIAPSGPGHSRCRLVVDEF